MPPRTNPMIGLMPETLLITDVKDIFAETTPGNAWTNRTPQQIIRTGIDGSIPISTPIHSEKSKYPTPDSSDINGTRGTKTRITIGTTAPPCSLNVSLNIDNIRKSATPDLRNYNNLDTSIDGKFTDNLVAPTIITELLCDKLSNSSSRDIYMRCSMNLTADTVNIPAPPNENLVFSAINSLYKSSSIWPPPTRV